MFARNDQHVHGRLRMEVGKGVHLIILVDGRGWNLAFNDFAKDAAHGDPSVSCGGTFWKRQQIDYRLPFTGERLLEKIQIEKTNFLLDIVY